MPHVAPASSGIALILGAGFNYDAALEAGVPNVRYPMLGDLLRSCFDLTVLPSGVSIEDLFAEATKRRDRRPVERLCDLLQTADYEIVERLRADRGADGQLLAAGTQVTRRDNLYLRFLRHVSPCAILTFNYDSLVELLLYSMGRWRPDDGYGVPVHAELEPGLSHPPLLPERSSTIVLHLHGALCLYADEFLIREDPRTKMGMIEARSDPEFIFDPDVNTLSFFPFVRTYPRPSFEYVDGRIIAPVPRKAEVLQQVFVRRMTGRAIQAIGSADLLIAIGYRFTEVDEESYAPLLAAAAGKRVVLVLPEADELRGRMKREYPRVTWISQPYTFKAWGARGFTTE